MPSPSTSLATHRPELAGSFMEFDLEMQRRDYIATRVLPVTEVAKATGVFGKIPIEQLLQNPDVSRAPGSGYQTGQFTFTTDSFTCEEYGFEEACDDRESNMYSDFFEAEQVAAARAFEFVLQAAEQRAASLLFNASTWTPTAITNEWDDAANATPIADVETAVQAVYASSGLWPNALIINRKVFRNLRIVDEIQDLVKYQNLVDARAGTITVDALSQLFDLEVIVAGSTKNTANEGQTASLAPVWSDEYAMIARVATTNDIREPCVGRTFHYAEDGSEMGGRIESYRDESRRSDIVRVRHDVDEKVLYVEAAALLSNVTT